MNTAFVTEKIPSLIVTTGILLLPFSVVASFIVLGQAHFLMTYLYQYRAGKITRQYLMWYALIAIPVFLLASSVSWQTMTIIAACFFSLHFLFDESRLFQGRSHVSILALIPPVITFLATLIHALLAYDVRLWAFVVGFGLLAIFVRLYGTRSLTAIEVWYPNTITLLLIIAYSLDITLPTMTLFGGIIIYHVVSWYMHYYVKFFTLPPVQGKYLMEVGVINALLVLAYVSYERWWITLDVLDYIFLPSFYYAWAILHILFTSHEFFAMIRERIRAHKSFR